jgi:hypothetical protein
MNRCLTAIIALAFVGCSGAPINNGVSLRTDRDNGRDVCARAVMKVEGASRTYKPKSSFIEPVARGVTELSEYFSRLRAKVKGHYSVSEKYGTVQVEACAERR